jgi:hypothetical protein
MIIMLKKDIEALFSNGSQIGKIKYGGENPVHVLNY